MFIYVLKKNRILIKIFFYDIQVVLVFNSLSGDELDRSPDYRNYIRLLFFKALILP